VDFARLTGDFCRRRTLKLVRENHEQQHNRAVKHQPEIRRLKIFLMIVFHIIPSKDMFIDIRFPKFLRKFVRFARVKF
jgi:hypothetical protein